MERLTERLNLNDKSVEDLQEQEFISLYRHKLRLLNKGKIRLPEIEKMVKYVLFLNPSILDAYVGRIDECEWSVLAGQEHSTSFHPVTADKVDHPLWNCAYDCDGTRKDCEGYVVLSKDNKCL